MHEMLKQGREFNDAVIIAIRNGDFAQLTFRGGASNANPHQKVTCPPN
jgi:hypothetical protein